MIAFDQARYSRRRTVDRVVQMLALIATFIGLFFLAAILFTLVYRGFSAWNLALFTKDTPAAGSIGGLRNAIVGSLLLTVDALAIGVPVGLLAGTYLAEYNRGSRIAETVQFVNDVLLSTPSIIVGLFVWNLMVSPNGFLKQAVIWFGHTIHADWLVRFVGSTNHFSGWAGAVALSILVIPVMVRTTVDMLALVPNALREAAAALGAPKWQIVTRVCYRAALQGLMTGALLAFARISGETAPLLFTSLGNKYWSLDMSGPIASLPSVIFEFALGPYEDLRQIAWGGALLITVAILLMNITARSLATIGSLK